MSSPLSQQSPLNIEALSNPPSLKIWSEAQLPPPSLPAERRGEEWVHTMTICASNAECRFTAITSSCFRVCSTIHCSNRKLPSKVPSDRVSLPKFHFSKHHNKNLFLHLALSLLRRFIAKMRLWRPN